MAIFLKPTPLPTGEQCEVCGKPAVSIVRDRALCPVMPYGYRKWVPQSTHYFCETHDREPRIIDGLPVWEE